MIVYLTEQGSELVKVGRNLVIKKGEYSHTIFTHAVSQIVIIGNIKITHPAIVLIFKFGIDAVFLAQNGKYIGRLAQEEPKNIFLRRKQFLLSEDKEFCLKTSKSIVIGKLTNLITVLMRISRTKKSSIAKDKAGQIRMLLNDIGEAKSVDSVRGYEGRGSALYFSALQYGLTKDWGFTKRVRRPPTDPVNSLLSLLYTFLMNKVYIAIRLASLEPYVGTLHTLDYGRYSLVFDLMEEFRPIIADTLMLSILNLEILNDSSFEREEVSPIEEAKEEGEISDLSKVVNDPIGLMRPYTLDDDFTPLPEHRVSEILEENINTTGKYPIKIVDTSIRKVIEAFEKKLSTKFYHSLAGKELTYLDAINFQARYYRRVIEGDVGEYVPLLLR
ncbi:MAG: CRISPR-associated endonuclease Cas1 [Bdellovibrionota bacterium]